MKIIVLILAGVACGLFAQAGEKFSGKVVRIIDGNTVEAATQDNEVYRIKLYGINCPELGQDYGVTAKNFLEKLVLEKIVTITITGKDRWGTRMGVVMNGDVDLRNELLKEGLAWTMESNPDVELEALKQKARENGSGLWKEKDPTPPWTFRRQQSMSQAKSS